MLSLLWLIPALPVLGFVILALTGSRLPRGVAAGVGVGSVGLAALVTILMGLDVLGGTAELPYTQTLWTWMHAGDLDVEITLSLDALSLLMIFVVTFVGFLIHLYSAEFMGEDEAFSRFFAYMNLFVGMMLTLVLGRDLLVLYLGWEGVGLCSYLLIGFWYAEEANGRAARKAFLVTRVGDAAMAVGLFILFWQLGTLQIPELLERTEQRWSVGTFWPIAAAALLLVGALGKSAQLPLQTWLPDAMAGPTPVSALIHAATMVTAGVYLVARTHSLFLLAPPVQTAVAVIGALTLLVAGCSALTQRDIKRVLAYSTISQIGYMFLALGVGAFSAAMFHFMTHAFFKALLFLGAGVVIHCLHHEHDMFRMGDLRRDLPVTFWTFLAASASLAALPLVTAGFYSKDMILWRAWSSPMGSPWLWLAGLLGAAVTSLYTFRMVFLTFFGEAGETVRHLRPVHKPGLRMQLPLVVLGVLSVVAGFVEVPEAWGGVPAFSEYLHPVFTHTEHAAHASVALEITLQVVAAIVSLGGIYFAWLLYLQRRELLERLWQQYSWSPSLHRFWALGWRFDDMYDRLLVQPYVRAASANRRDVIDRIPEAIATLSRMFHAVLSRTETGLLRNYAMGIALGAVVATALMVLL